MPWTACKDSTSTQRSSQQSATHASGVADSSLTLLPLSIIVQRGVPGAKGPSGVFLPILMATYVATVVALVSFAIKQRIDLRNRVIGGWICGISAAIGTMMWYFVQFMTRTEIETVSKVASNLGHHFLHHGAVFWIRRHQAKSLCDWVGLVD